MTVKIILSHFLLTLLMFLFFLFPLANLAVQEIFFSSRFGNYWEFWMHGLTSILFYAFYAHYILVKHQKNFSLQRSFLFGLTWTFLFCFFFYGLAGFFFGLSLQKILQAFNFFQGELLPIFILLILLSPPVIWYFKITQ
jgi:hypothetical protein